MVTTLLTVVLATATLLLVDTPHVNNAQQKGLAFLENGDYGAAIDAFADAIQADPRNGEAYFLRASAYENKGDQDHAVADYAHAVQLDPRFAKSYCERGLAAARSPVIGGDESMARGPGGGKPPQRLNLFVAPNGNDRNPGTIERPFATLYRAIQFAEEGDTINLRGGTYQAMVHWNKSGTPTAPITVQAYRDEEVRLQSSEQFPWTRVSDPTFGDCWKAKILYRPIRYPGLEHAIWEDADAAAANPEVQVWAIVKGGYACAPMHAAADFAYPQKAKGLPLSDENGNLIYDITWFDRDTKTLWFKAGRSHVTDPSSQLYVTSTSSGQFSIEGSYTTLRGLKFEYLNYFHQQGNPMRCDIDRCEIKHAGGGIVGGGRRCTYTSLFIDKIGDWLTWRNNRYDRGYLAHCFYFNGSRCLIANCFFGRSNKGGPIHNYPDGVKENLFDSNVLYYSDGGSIFMGSGKNYITNNISLQKVYGMSPYVSMQGFSFKNNYSEGAYPFGFAYQEQRGTYVGTFEKYAILGNVLNNQGGWIEYRGNVVDAKECRIDGNVYVGKPHWRLGLTQADPPRAAFKDYTSFPAYRAALQALPGFAQWEKGSRAVSDAPKFDFASTDALLDSDPLLETVLLKTRQYVKDAIAPFPNAGPAMALEAVQK
jgi:tetratricopeptide (TPR) repeat protein